MLRPGGDGHLRFTDPPHAAGPGEPAAHLPADVHAELLGTLAPGRATEPTRARTRAYVDRSWAAAPRPCSTVPPRTAPSIEFRWSRGR
ncbi:hypothetical protein [Kitasatospora sp. NPDC050463]|uniref:hypothetical protein n=1 Tax=Kitasatospora sp. NPDC050463 TaxID=3155786 RepID=UPI0033CA3DBE